MWFLRAGLMVFPWNMLPARCTLTCSPGPLGRMEQPFEDADKAMTSQVPRAGAWCDGGHHDDDDDDDDDVNLFFEILTKVTLNRHSAQYAIPDVAYHVTIGGKVAMHKEALYQIPLWLGWSHVACISLAQQQRLPVWPAHKQGELASSSTGLCKSSGWAWRSPWGGSWWHDSWTEMLSAWHCHAHSSREGFARSCTLYHVWG